jgi:hypothetical protein
MFGANSLANSGAGGVGLKRDGLKLLAAGRVMLARRHIRIQFMIEYNCTAALFCSSSNP